MLLLKLMELDIYFFSFKINIFNFKILSKTKKLLKNPFFIFPILLRFKYFEAL